jgi:glycine/D-amino acid oxidase-like deaminating enzyme
VTADRSHALAGARSLPLWLDSPSRPTPRPSLDADLTVDLAIVGGGFTGLWAAVLAAEADPGRTVALLEASTLGWAASGRNGGFCSSSLTHGLDNGLSRWADEMPRLLRLGERNLDELEADIARHGIECDFTRAGELTVAVTDWQAEGLRQIHATASGLGQPLELLDSIRTRALADSPTYRSGLLDRRGTAVLDPARLVWGLADTAERLGVSIYEGSRVAGLHDEGDRVRVDVVSPPGPVTSGSGRSGSVRSGSVRSGSHCVRANRVVLGTNAFPSPLRRLRPFVVPVWDHVLATEPLTDTQWSDLGWPTGVGISDAGNQFHYYRTTADRRVVWGGYDALYYYGSDLSPARTRRPATEQALAEHFFATFPQLAGVRFSHAWAGAIDTCTRFTAFWSRASRGKVAAVQGYTGLGVGASRFGARVALDLVDGTENERTALAMVRRPPVPFPPEPLRWAGITMTRRSIARADANGGRRDRWLRTLDRLGLGFDS